MQGATLALSTCQLVIRSRVQNNKQTACKFFRVYGSTTNATRNNDSNANANIRFDLIHFILTQ